VLVTKRLVAPTLKRLSARTRSGIDDAVAHALTKLRVVWVIPLALWAAVPPDVFTDEVMTVLRSAAWIGAAVQVGTVISAWLDYWITHLRAAAGDSENKAPASLGIVSVLVRIAIWAVLALMLLDNLGFNVATLVAGLGVGGIAIGLAVQKVLGDLFSYFAIIFDKPFEVGHFVIVDEFTGTVEHIGIKTTRVRSLGGELIVFGNADLTQSRLRNYRQMQERRIPFAFGIEYSTPAALVEQVPAMVKEIIDGCEHTRFERAHFQKFGDSSLDFEVIYWMKTPDYGAYMDAQQYINMGLLRRFEQEGIAFAFPSRTLYLQPPAMSDDTEKAA